MLVTNSQLKVSDENCSEDKPSFMSRMLRAFGNSFNKMIALELDHADSKLGTVELAGCVAQSVNEGLSKDKSN